MFIGPGGSGKSSLMYRMINRRLPYHTSTGVAKQVVIVDVNPPTIHPVTVLDSTRWEQGELDVALVAQMHTYVNTSKSQSDNLQMHYKNLKASQSPQYQMKPLPVTTTHTATTTAPSTDQTANLHPKSAAFQQNAPQTADRAEKAKPALKTKPSVSRKMRKAITIKLSKTRRL